MRLIDAEHLKKWILQRWEKAYSQEEVPTIEILDQIDRELASNFIRCKYCKRWLDIPTSEEFNRCEKDALIRHKNFFCASFEVKKNQ